jgi:hypothetical protein
LVFAIIITARQLVGKIVNAGLDKTHPAVKAVYAALVALVVGFWWFMPYDQPEVPNPAASKPAPQYKPGERRDVDRLLEKAR